MFQGVRKAVGVLGKVVRSPVTGKVLHGARVVSDVANLVGVPGTGALSKGLATAEKVLGSVQKFVK